MEITKDTNINQLLKSFPQLEDFLMELNPKYKKLKNPILRRTIANIATLKQVAMIGGFSADELVDILRREVGQKPLNVDSEDEKTTPQTEPEWAKNSPKVVLNANEILDNEKNPLAEVSKELKKLDSNELLMIKSDFLPQPLIDKFEEEGFEVFAKELSEDEFETYILKR